MAVISFRHAFVFVKTTKTAGTSIEAELAKRVEPEAIVTPVIPPVDGHDPRNFKRGVFRSPYYNHMPATLIERYVGKDVFAKMFKFCVEREPVSKCISHFHMLKNSAEHRRRGSDELTWASYCTQGSFPIDLEKYSSVRGGGRVSMVDEFIPYEDLQSSLDRVSANLGLPPLSLETKAKSEYSQARFVRKEDVTPAEREIIYAAFKDSLDVSGLADRYKL